MLQGQQTVCLEQYSENLDIHRMAPYKEHILETKELFFYINRTIILEYINLSFCKNRVTAIIGPSGSGKTTLLRCFNKMYDLTPGASLKGKIIFKGNDITNGYDVYKLRCQIGMVFQKPCVFPKSIYQNVIFGLHYLNSGGKNGHAAIVEEKLREVYLWDEVKDRLHKNASGLSLGQQQRLCIARALSLEPEVILLDEPTSSLDPKSTEAIERLIKRLKERHTIIFVTHNLNQAKRIADDVVFVCKGRVCETGDVRQFFENPCKEDTMEYIRGIC
jgi:phosphate transport system ATP-binding protein